MYTGEQNGTVTTCSSATTPTCQPSLSYTPSGSSPGPKQSSQTSPKVRRHFRPWLLVIFFQNHRAWGKIWPLLWCFLVCQWRRKGWNGETPPPPVWVIYQKAGGNVKAQAEPSIPLRRADWANSSSVATISWRKFCLRNTHPTPGLSTSLLMPKLCSYTITMTSSNTPWISPLWKYKLYI